MSENGNGSFKPIEIDVKDEHAFRTGVVQHLQLIADQTRDIPSIKKKVDKHEVIYQVGKWASVPIIGAAVAYVKSWFHKP